MKRSDTMIPDSTTRVEGQTSLHIKQAIDKTTQDRIEFYRSQSNDAITQRLRELDEEWDTERVLQTIFGIFSGLGALLTVRVHKRWAWPALGVPTFMVQHALQGWCPPLAVLRRLRVRTAREINEERFALKALRGDFDGVADSGDAEAIVRAVQS
jgi:hypothetical protein